MQFHDQTERFLAGERWRISIYRYDCKTVSTFSAMRRCYGLLSLMAHLPLSAAYPAEITRKYDKGYGTLPRVPIFSSTGQN